MKCPICEEEIDFGYIGEVNGYQMVLCEVCVKAEPEDIGFWT